MALRCEPTHAFLLLKIVRSIEARIRAFLNLKIIITLFARVKVLISVDRTRSKLVF